MYIRCLGKNARDIHVGPNIVESKIVVKDERVKSTTTIIVETAVNIHDVVRISITSNACALRIQCTNVHRKQNVAF